MPKSRSIKRRSSKKSRSRSQSPKRRSPVRSKKQSSKRSTSKENKPLEKFWQGLASGKYVVIIYKNGKHKYVKLPNKGTQKFKKIFNDFELDKEIKAILSSSMSRDTYDLYLYPKAKDKSVDYVISNYKKYFKSIGDPEIKKLLSP